MNEVEWEKYGLKVKRKKKEMVIIDQLQHRVSNSLAFSVIVAKSFAEYGVSIYSEVLRANFSIYFTAKLLIYPWAPW